MPSLSSRPRRWSASRSAGSTYTVRSQQPQRRHPAALHLPGAQRRDRPDRLAARVLRHSSPRSTRATPMGTVQLVSNAASVFQSFTGNLATPFEIIAAAAGGDRGRNPGAHRGDAHQRDRRALRAAVEPDRRSERARRGDRRRRAAGVAAAVALAARISASEDPLPRQGALSPGQALRRRADRARARGAGAAGPRGAGAARPLRAGPAGLRELRAGRRARAARRHRPPVASSTPISWPRRARAGSRS